MQADVGKWYAELSNIIINTYQKEIKEYITLHYHTTPDNKHELNEHSFSIHAEWGSDREEDIQILIHFAWRSWSMHILTIV